MFFVAVLICYKHCFVFLFWLQPNPLNRSRKLPAAYERLLQSEYRTADENADWLW